MIFAGLEDIADIGYAQAMLAFCSMSRTVTPMRFISLMMSKIPFTTMGARPRGGSSIMIIFGRLMSARADGKHLLFAARERTRGLPGALLEPREEL